MQRTEIHDELTETPPVKLRHESNQGDTSVLEYLKSFIWYTHAHHSAISFHLKTFFACILPPNCYRKVDAHTPPKDLKEVKEALLHVDHTKHGVIAVPHNEPVIEKEKPKALTKKQLEFHKEVFFWDILFNSIKLSL